VAEKTSLLLKTRYGLEDLKLIHTRHGAGDRAIGFNKASAGFDHVLVSGPKVRERLIQDAGVAPDRLSTVGYPKFDLMPAVPPRLPIQANGKPTVLYNPHVSPHLSSWFKHGRAVIEHFLDDDRYNLIFAPHVMLFHRRFVLTIDKLRVDRPGLIDQRVLDAPNIHVDLGSRACTDMTYTAAADIYLGDVSSQIYEFLHRPRPCVFLNSHEADWQGNPNYAHWQAGQVITDPADLGAVLDRAVAEQKHYLPIQRELFERSFDLTSEPSSSRAARAVLAALDRPTVRPVVPLRPALSRPVDRPSVAAA
jgi:CDP-glycerol glycerophosphotransferase (TagB/SpsB family)